MTWELARPWGLLFIVPFILLAVMERRSGRAALLLPRRPLARRGRVAAVRAALPGALRGLALLATTIAFAGPRTVREVRAKRPI